MSRRQSCQVQTQSHRPSRSTRTPSILFPGGGDRTDSSPDSEGAPPSPSARPPGAGPDPAGEVHVTYPDVFGPVADP